METRNKRINTFLNGMFTVPLISENYKAEEVFQASFSTEAELDETLESFRKQVVDALIIKMAALEIPSAPVEHDGGVVSKMAALWSAFEKEAEASAFPLDIIALNPNDWKAWPAVAEQPPDMELDAFFRFSEFTGRLLHGVAQFTWEDSGLFYEDLKKGLISGCVPSNTSFLTPSRNISFKIKARDGSAFSVLEGRRGKALRIEYSIKPIKAELVKRYVLIEKGRGQ